MCCNICNHIAHVQGQSSVDVVLVQKSPTLALKALVTRADQRGIYKLNLDNQEGRQLMLNFQEEKADADSSQSAPVADQSLSLF